MVYATCSYRVTPMLPPTVPAHVVDALAWIRAAIREGHPATAVLSQVLTGMALDALITVSPVNGEIVPPGGSVTTSIKANPECRLLTPDEAAVLAGPSFTAKRLYRLRGSMPEQVWVRKGGRLYFREGPYRRWLAMR